MFAAVQLADYFVRAGLVAMAAAARPTCTLHRRVSPCIVFASVLLVVRKTWDRRSLHSQSIFLLIKRAAYSQ